MKNICPQRKPTQIQLCYAALEKVAQKNEAFMWMVQNGLTRTDLQRMIDRWPDRYGMYENWLANLPD
jgi:hypothetical protein